MPRAATLLRPGIVLLPRFLIPGPRVFSVLVLDLRGAHSVRRRVEGHVRRVGCRDASCATSAAPPRPVSVQLPLPSPYHKTDRSTSTLLSTDRLTSTLLSTHGPHVCSRLRVRRAPRRASWPETRAAT
eukprot:9054103-Pyramimonas_sp.AAC.1